ncbi:MAG: DUF58 domain-containing protein [Pseudomonadales bacterium]|nr:DUF58 domain-containing protein [Pseudomonadales bacterium]
MFRAYQRWSLRHNGRTRRTTDRGQLVFAGMLVAGALGIDTDRSLVYQFFALLLVIVVASRLALRFYQPQVRVSRELPEYVTSGQPFSYRIRITNTGDRPETDLEIQDNPQIRVPGLVEFQTRREPGEASRNLWDRYIGYHRYMWLRREKTGLDVAPADVPDVPVRSSIAVELNTTPLRRGLVTFESVSVRYPDPFRIRQGIQIHDHPQQLMILPARYTIPSSFRFPARPGRDSGVRQGNRTSGESAEFTTLRDYQEGDSIRRIHWLSTARRGSPVVKEFADQQRQRFLVILHTAGPVTELREAAISVAASLLAYESDSPLHRDLICITDQMTHIDGTDRQGLAAQLRFLGALPANAGHCLQESEIGAVTAQAVSEADGLIYIRSHASEAETTRKPVRFAIPHRTFTITLEFSDGQSPNESSNGDELLIPFDRVQERLAKL